MLRSRLRHVIRRQPRHIATELLVIQIVIQEFDAGHACVRIVDDLISTQTLRESRKLKTLTAHDWQGSAGARKHAV